MDSSLFSDARLSADIDLAGKKYAAVRVAELVAEDPSRSAQQVLDLLLAETDAAQRKVQQLRESD